MTQNLLKTMVLATLGILTAAVASALFLLPGRIPAQFHWLGSVARVGSKYELLAYPLAGTAVFWVLGRGEKPPRLLSVNLLINLALMVSAGLRLFQAFALPEASSNRRMMLVVFLVITGITLAITILRTEPKKRP